MINENIFYPLLSFIPALLNVGILIYLFFFVPRGKITDIFSLFVLCLLLWQVEDTIVRVCTSAETARFWDRILCIGWAAFAPIAFHFACSYTSSKLLQNRFSLILIYLPVIVLYLLYIASNEPAVFIYHENWGWVNTPRPGTLDGVQRIIISCYVVAAVFILFRYAIKVRKQRGKRFQAFLIAIGMFIPTVQGTITQIIYPVILGQQEIPITSTFMTFFSLATIISISRYQLFNISESIEVETVLQNLKNIVFVVSPQKQIIYMNPFADRAFKIKNKREEPIHSIFPSPFYYNQFVTDVFETSLNGEPVKNFTTAFQTGDGKRIDVLLSTEVIRNNKQVQGLLLVAIDITERLKTLSELEIRNSELERFAYVASHDLQEPLRMMSLFLQLLQAKYTDQIDEAGNSYINSAINNATRMKKLILDLLEYSRIGSTENKFGLTDMNEVVEIVLNNLQSQIDEAGATIDLDDLPPLPHSNTTQMLQLMQNLISNALKFHSDKKPHVQITATDQGDHWLFAVKDNGIGIDSEYHDKVFVVFQRLHNKKDYSGTGIGLAICKKIVEQHGGQIWIDSNPGSGSTFYFTILKSIVTNHPSPMLVSDEKN